MTNEREAKLLKACEDARHELTLLHNLIVRDREDGPEWWTDTTDVVNTLTAVLENKSEPRTMTRLEQLRNVISPLISEQQQGDLLLHIIPGAFCPADKALCAMATDKKCLKCWNREVSVG